MLSRSQLDTNDKHRSKWQLLMEVFGVSLKLGLTSFGGPIAHLGYFHHEYVDRRKWMDEKGYADLVALCQFLPGPASSQVGIGIGITRAGMLGGIAAWIGFTLPSVIALVLFAMLIQGTGVESLGWIHGLKIVAVVVVAQAILGMSKNLAPDRTRISILGGAAILAWAWTSPFSQVAIIACAGLLGWWFYRSRPVEPLSPLKINIRRSAAIASLVLFAGLLLILPLMRAWTGNEWIALMDSFYRSGSLVFGGGHVVLPLLEHELVPTGWVSREAFLTGYGAAQAVPGPLFTFAAYLGTVSHGIIGGIVATLAIFLPAFLLVAGTLPFWNTIRNKAPIQGILAGVNAAVVGILLAALYDPLWTSAILGTKDAILGLLLFILLVHWKLPPWVIVLIGALGGTILFDWL
ncbi:chromate transporter [Paenibacillus sp. 1001270B_150601_E10]|uniref:chromate transporter n=1 Tax=Paenibacillus sp. 1001270B_150601_E10 TaxID=2787079 RepID=UPI00189E83A8|nr:chromate transporter [Paenibacillus sp. 1001270B_150601_E10]